MHSPQSPFRPWSLLFALASMLVTAPTLARDWLAFGEIRGHLEPCGCSPETDLGGIARIGHGIVLARHQTPGIMVFNLGNDGPLEADPPRAAAIYEALALIKPEASLPQAADLRNGAQLRHHRDNLPWVLSHAKANAPYRDLIQPHISGPGFIAYGINTELPDTESISPELLDTWTRQLRDKTGMAKVLLIATKDEVLLTKILNAKLFDAVISANPRPAAESPSAIERLEPGRLRTAGGVYRVPAFGQGLLRRPPEVGETLPLPPRGLGLASPGCPPLVPGCMAPPSPVERPQLFTLGEQLVVWLDKSYQPLDGPFLQIMARYDAARTDSFRSTIPERLKMLPETPFAGAAACQACHPSAVAKWQNSKHFQALETLKSKSKDTDAECLSCHVLGLKTPGGFVSEEHTPNFQGVQCEQCHGPRKAHTTNPLLKGTAKPREGCQDCHHNPHSPRFDFAKYWPKIEHGREGKAPP